MTSTKKTTVTNAAKPSDWHVHRVFNDPDFAKEFDQIEEIHKNGSLAGAEYVLCRENLAKRWLISLDKLIEYEIARIIPLTQKTSNAEFHADIKNGKFSITFSPTATLAEVTEEWHKFEALRSIDPSWARAATRRRRNPLEMDLIYSIFRQRMESRTFPQIYTLYRDGKLPLYRGSATQFPSSSSLERYYNLYKSRLIQ